MTEQKEKFVITELYAVVGDDEEGEGVWSMTVGNKEFPMVGGDWERMKTYVIPAALDVSEASGNKFKILKFSTRRDVTEEVISKYKSENK